MTEKQIIERLEHHGFEVQKDKNNPGEDARGWSNYKGDFPLRLEHPDVGKRSSLYVAPDFISALGKFRELDEEVPPTTYNSTHKEKPAPQWEGTELVRLLDAIGRKYS